ncbi:uncharacterized protein LOC144709081 [Wolffia australiana]
MGGATRWGKSISPSQVVEMIRAEKNTAKALLIFDSATAEYPSGFRHDHHTFSLIIARLAAANQTHLAETLLSRMADELPSPSEAPFLSLISAYAKSHRPLQSLRLFRQMESSLPLPPSPHAQITLFSILVRSNQLKLAHQFYRRMRQDGTHNSTPAYNVLLSAFCKSPATIATALKVFDEMPSRGCPPDAYTYTTLISGLAKLGRTDQAMALFREMKNEKLPPNVVTFSGLIHGLCLNGKLDEALEVFSSMGSSGVAPNGVTYGCLMAGLCKGGRAGEGVRLLERMVREGVEPGRFVYCAVVRGLCREGRAGEGAAVLDRMRLQGLAPDAGLCGKVVAGLCHGGRAEDAANLLDEVAVAPSRVTWGLVARTHNLVARSLCAAGSGARARQVQRRMKAMGISAEPETYSLIVSSLCRLGEVLRACAVVQDMVAEGCAPDEPAWAAVATGLCRRRAAGAAAVALLRQLTG